jgi:hypothetical protein
MPLRLLLYIGRLYEKLIDNRSVYRQKLIEIPKPDFIVLYNGDAEYPDKETLKLSDAFARPRVPGTDESVDLPNLLELTVNVYNINRGRNPDILQKSGSLNDYAIFMERVKANKSNGMPLEIAVKEAIKHCTDNGIMREFLENHGSEVENMLFTEFNMDDAQKVWFEEGVEEGMEKGREEGLNESVVKMLRNGFDPKVVADCLELPVSKVEELAARIAR